ncbi:transposable element Tcb2 transposase [Trichonephila clavipes]|nr:transposable element Tcb2 transposase [Trichonephila clavipes]
MDDNAPCHREVLIDDFLETENIQRMSWLANSHDLNPIEHVWDMLDRQIAALSHPPSFVTEWKRALQDAWNRLSPQLIHHLIASGLGIQHPAYPHLVAAPCPTGYFPCNTSDVCVEQRMNCDSNADCPDSSDEWSCGKSLPLSLKLIASRQRIRTFYQ